VSWFLILEPGRGRYGDVCHVSFFASVGCMHSTATCTGPMGSLSRLYIEYTACVSDVCALLNTDRMRGSSDV
jgi:hypothetical protein